MTTRAQQRSPNRRNLAYEIEKDLVSTRAVSRYCKRCVDIAAVIYKRDFGRLVNAEHFLEQRVGELFRVGFCEIDAEPVVEISLRAISRKIKSELVDPKRARARKYRLRRSYVAQKLRRQSHITFNPGQVLTFLFN